MPSMPFNLPNVLTWLRILTIPLLVGIYYAPYDWIADHNRNLVATLVFAFAAITDWLDGYLARTLNQTSAFGAFLDPVADKLMVATALITLVWLGRVEGYIAAIIIGREIAISALREWMAQSENRVPDGGAGTAALPRRDPQHQRIRNRHLPHLAGGDPHALVHGLLPQDGMAGNTRLMIHKGFWQGLS
jgi:phosphatidylglycerophosphate synthase